MIDSTRQGEYLGVMGIEFDYFDMKMLLPRLMFESQWCGERGRIYFTSSSMLVWLDLATIPQTDSPTDRQCSAGLLSTYAVEKRLADIVVIHGADNQSFSSMEEALGGERSR